MKKNFTFFLLLFACLLSNAQTITPVTTGAYCPGTTQTFKVTLPGSGYYGAQAYGWPVSGSERHPGC